MVVTWGLGEAGGDEELVFVHLVDSYSWKIGKFWGERVVRVPQNVSAHFTGTSPLNYLCFYFYLKAQSSICWFTP